MQSNRFVVLTGHLSNYPLPDLVGILRHQRKSGRLLIEYSKGPAMFFFQDGELIDARLNDLTGLQAICVALAQPEASFNFNPLIQSPRRSIEPSLQRAVSELFGCWDESALQIEATTTPPPEVLALPPAPPVFVRQRSVLLIAAAVLIIVGLSTVIAVTGGFTKNAAATAASLPQSSTQPAPVASAPSELPVHKAAPETLAKPKRAANERKEEKPNNPEPAVTEPAPQAATEPAPQAIRVVMQIENGRVLKASVANPKPGMDSYEAMALRIARQRRYPPTVTGGETVTINVNR
ncbi:MAG TPA: DUF4388 domain-containing protein [Pyrinomonadaceae bacterium]